MTTAEAVASVIDALESVGMPYMLVGAYSANAYVLVRSTKDADFEAQFAAHGLSDLSIRLCPQFVLDSQIRCETSTGTSHFLLRVAGSPFTIELFRLNENDAFSRNRFSRRLRQAFMGRNPFLPTPEDVVITKLRWSRQGRRAKDLDDARNVIAVQQNNLNWTHIHERCDTQGTRETLERVRASIPPL